MNFCRLTIQEPIFSVSNTEFEGGDDGHGHGDHTFLVKQAQPSHTGWAQLNYCTGTVGPTPPAVYCTAGSSLDPTLRNKVITAFPLFDFATSLF